jgi:hypothetical protein
VDEGAAETLGSEMTEDTESETTEDTESETTENTEQDQHGDTGAPNLNEDRSRPRFARVHHSRLPRAGTRPSRTRTREYISPCVLSNSASPC